MKKILKGICTAAALLAGSSMAYAAPINVGGVVWDPDSGADLTSQTSLYEDAVINAGDELTGYGIVQVINGLGNFCPGCELTYVFSGYILDTSLVGLPDEEFNFTGGSLQIYVDNTPDFDFEDPTSAANGVLWLDLMAVDPDGDGFTLSGELDLLVIADGVLDLAGDGDGYFDVVGGLAAGNFDTNGQFGGTDLSFTSSFQPWPNGPTAGSTHYGTAEIAGNTIPEPSTIALFGLSLLGLGFARRKATS